MPTNEEIPMKKDKGIIDIVHIKRWNLWRKNCRNNMFCKLLVLFKIIASPTLTSRAWHGIGNDDLSWVLRKIYGKKCAGSISPLQVNFAKGTLKEMNKFPEEKIEKRYEKYIEGLIEREYWNNIQGNQTNIRQMKE